MELIPLPVKYSILLLALSYLLACKANTEKPIPQKEPTTTITDTAYYTLDYQLQPGYSYSMSYHNKHMLNTKKTSAKPQWNPKNWDKNDSIVSSTKEFYTLKTRGTSDSINLVITLDSTRHLGIPAKYSKSKKDQPYEKMGKGSSMDGKEISMAGKYWSKWPSRKAWEHQESLPRGKFKPGETYTYHQTHYNNHSRADTIEYLFKEVKDSIAFFDVIPRDILRTKTIVHVTGQLEYDLRKEIYRKAVRYEESENTFELEDGIFTMKKSKVIEYNINNKDSY